MHYFKRNIGDYHKKAGRLSMLEHGAYTLLLDSCYDRERFPTKDDAIEWCWARTQQEIDAVIFVLGKFFDLVDGVYVQNRIQEELEQYKRNALTNKEIALKREEARRTNRERLVNEPPPNHKPITNNQEPLTINHKPIKTPSVSREKIAFDGSSFSGYGKFIEKWQEAYPAIDVLRELRKAEAWLISNPKNSKSNYERFLNNWLSRAQDKAPSARASPDRPKNNADKWQAAMIEMDKRINGDKNEPRDITGVAERVDS